MNILKEKNGIDTNQYQKISTILNFDKVWDSILSGANSYRFFNIERVGNSYIKILPKNSYCFLNNLLSLSNILKDKAKQDLLSINQEKTINLKYKKKILCFLHMDIILCMQYLREVDNKNQAIIEYLQFETKIDNIHNRLTSYGGNNISRSNIYTTNKDSVILNTLKPELSSKIDKLTLENRTLIEENPLLSFIEIGNGFDNEKLHLFLTSMNNYCFKICQNHEIKKHMKFSLKIRKIKRTNKNAMYIVKQNTIVLDPRHTDSFVHELGHWYHTWFKPEIVSEIQAEEFAEKFVNYIDKSL